MARQPIYDRAGHVRAYELLFRGGAGDDLASRRNAYATSNVIIGAFTDVGLVNLVGDRLCFVNFELFQGYALSRQQISSTVGLLSVL